MELLEDWRSHWLLLTLEPRSELITLFREIDSIYRWKTRLMWKENHQHDMG